MAIGLAALLSPCGPTTSSTLAKEVSKTAVPDAVALTPLETTTATPTPPTPTPSVVATAQHAPTIRRRADPTPAPARPPSTRRPADINGVVQPDREYLGGHIGERQAGLDRDPTALVLQLLPAGSAEPRRRRLDGARTGEQWLLYAVGRLPFRPGATLSALITAISPKFGIRVR